MIQAWNIELNAEFSLNYLGGIFSNIGGISCLGGISYFLPVREMAWWFQSRAAKKGAETRKRNAWLKQQE